jgi:hypothetical protein
MMTLLTERTNIRERRDGAIGKRAFIRESSSLPSNQREIVIIEAGWGSSGYYEESVLSRDIPVIFPEGTHMYLNHPTLKEDSERPERDLRDLVAVTTEAPRMMGIASVSVMEIFDHWLPVFSNEKFLEAIGLSIRAFGITEQGDAGGKSGPIVKQLTEGLSIDFVTMAGAGGKVATMTEAARGIVVPLIESAREHQAPIRETLASDTRERLCNLGTEAWGDDETYVYCEDFDPDERYAIFWINPDSDAGYYYKQAYASDDSGDLSFEGEPETVERDTQYVPAKENKVPSKLLDEARNAGNWFEARIHRDFTEVADRLFGEGNLTREERINLSTAIGEGLKSFSATLESLAPQLFSRDPYAELEAPEEAYISENKGGHQPPNEGDTMTDEERRRLQEAEDRVRQLEGENATLKEEKGKLETRVERSEEANLRNEASMVAAEAIGSPEGLSARGIARAVRECLSAGLPTHSDGTLDRGLVQERARNKAREELEYIGAIDEGGTVRGLGESRRDSQLPGGGGNGGGGGGDEVTEESLTEAFQSIGMPEGVAKLAAGAR